MSTQSTEDLSFTVDGDIAYNGREFKKGEVLTLQSDIVAYFRGIAAEGDFSTENLDDNQVWAGIVSNDPGPHEEPSDREVVICEAMGWA